MGVMMEGLEGERASRPLALSPYCPLALSPSHPSALSPAHPSALSPYHPSALSCNAHKLGARVH